MNPPPPARAIPLAGVPLMVASMALFACMAIAGRIAAREMSAPQLVAIRFASMLAVLIPLHLSGHARVRPGNLRLLALRGLFGGLAVLTFFVALARCRDTGTASLLNNISPLFTNLLAVPLLGERLTGRLGAGLVIALVGVGLVVAPDPSGLTRPGVGELAGLASALLSALAVISLRAARATDDAVTILFAFCVGGLAISALPAALDWRAASSDAWLAALVVGGTSLLAQLGMTHAFGLLPAGRGATWQLTTPLFTFALAWPLLGEPIAPAAAAGAGLTVAAIAWATSRAG